MSSYGFIFPKQGKTIDDGIKDLAWTADKQVFLARPPVYKTVTIPSGTNLNDYYISTDLGEVEHGDYHVFRAFLKVGSNNYAIDPKNYLTIGTVPVVVYAEGSQGANEESSTGWSEAIGLSFTRQTPATTTSAVEVTLTAYLVEVLL